jgi:hypothetical protein
MSKPDAINGTGGSALFRPAAGRHDAQPRPFGHDHSEVLYRTEDSEVSSACQGPNKGGEEYTLTIRALKSGTPPIIRLRHVLKSLLRTYEFRCVSVSETTPALPPLPTHADGAGGSGDA